MVSEISFFEIRTTLFNADKNLLNSIQEINLHISQDFASESPEESKKFCMLDENVFKSVLDESDSTKTD